jgi:UDP-N-acetylmuramyl pentapeptide phosphotransferase/UDP-N-acetylglucosamine-1-phosphate transferase
MMMTFWHWMDYLLFRVAFVALGSFLVFLLIGWIDDRAMRRKEERREERRQYQ